MTSQDVEFHLESMVPEIEDLRERGIFSEKELKQISLKRRDFEYLIHRKQTRKNDMLRYIQYEISVDDLRKKRKERMKLNTAEMGMTISDYSIVRRIHNLYQKTLKKFGSDPSIWIQYFEWSKKVGSTRALGKNFAKAIQAHPTKNLFWILASKYEFEENNSITSARVLLQRAIRVNPKDKKLWLEYFKLELLWIEKLKERRKILLKEEIEENDHVELDNLENEGNSEVLNDDKILLKSYDESTDNTQEKSPAQIAIMELLVPRTIYKNAILTIPDDLQFRADFISIYSKFGAFNIARKEVVDSIEKDFKNNEHGTKIICEQSVTGVDKDDFRYPELLNEACNAYLERLSKKPTQLLFDFYFEFLNMTKTLVEEENLIEYCKIMLLEGFQLAKDKNFCSLGSYHLWYQVSKDESVLNYALQKYKDSTLIWMEKIKISQDKPNIYELALKNTNIQSEIWKDYIKWTKSHHPSNLDQIYLRSLNYLSLSNLKEDIDLVFEYLRYYYEQSGIDKFRIFVEDSIRNSTRNLDFYKAVLDIERDHFNATKQNKKALEKAWDVCHKHSPDNIGIVMLILDLWIEHFEQELDNPKQLSSLYWKASKLVKDKEELETRFQLLKNK